MTLDSRLRSKTTYHSHELILHKVIKIYKYIYYYIMYL